MSMNGYVYILVNQGMPGVFKVGCTQGPPHERAEYLSRPTGVPAPFEVLCYIEIPDYRSVERHAHDYLLAYRLNPRREFFFGGAGREGYALLEAVAWLYWHPKKVRFCEPELEFGNMFDLGGPLMHDKCRSLAETENPWDETVIVNRLARADRQPRQFIGFDT